MDFSFLIPIRKLKNNSIDQVIKVGTSGLKNVESTEDQTKVKLEKALEFEIVCEPSMPASNFVIIFLLYSLKE